jgi:hypothetical protein
MTDFGWDAGLNADCHYGDHRYNGAVCDNCGHFNGALLRYFAQEKADREGRGHFGHYHKTMERKIACKRQPEPDWVEAYGMSEVPA